MNWSQRVFFLLLVFTFCCIASVWSGYCYRQSGYTYRCGGRWRRRRCTAYRSIKECCPGWTGSSCHLAICDGKTNPGGACTIPGWVQESVSGPTHTESGGTCDKPEVCSNCNNGFYPDGPYCKACTPIAHCYYPKCTTAHNSVCHFCEGVVRDDPGQYGWWSYTRWRDAGQSCQRACSWRTGSRCYPGNCPQTTAASCICTPGFSGGDCNVITEDPVMLHNFVRLTHTTSTSAELLEGPDDPSTGSPQPTIWTNNLLFQTATATLDGQYVKHLPAAPSFINKADSYVGITTGAVSLKLLRGGSPAGASFVSRCSPSTPMANNYRCEGDFTFSDQWAGFEHLDKLIFTAEITNGGYITVIDREKSNSQGTYQMLGRTVTHEFEIKFDTEDPSHCVMTTGCQVDPLTVPDTTLMATFPISWDGWLDEVSGLKSYHLEVFHLRSTGTGTDAELVHGDKLIDAVNETLAVDVSQTTVTVPNPRAYSVVITTLDKAGNQRSARRISIFDDESTVELQGTRDHIANTGGSCTWASTPAALVVQNADPAANCEWTTDAPSTVTVLWKDHFINRRHHAGQWLNAVSGLAHVDQALDDNKGVRQATKKPNILGIVRFEVSYNVSYEGQTTHHPFTQLAVPLSESTIITEDMLDGKGVNITVRGYDIMETHEDDLIVIKADSSPPVLENLWLTRGDRLGLSIHNVEELAELTFEWESYDYHSGIHSVEWKLFDNYTQQTVQHGSAYHIPQGNTHNLTHCETEYGQYPRGAKCYCTPFDGCFHQHFQVKPMVVQSGNTGILHGKHMVNHDEDYYIEVTVTNRARLQTTRTIKITIDTSPPVTGSVHEGVAGGPEIDFQEDRQVHVHWKDFFDKESGVSFYRYGYGTECISAGAFDIALNSGLTETYTDYAVFNVTTEDTYYVTVAAYNRALDHSAPICSDGVTVDSSAYKVTEVVVKGAKTHAGLLLRSDDSVWYIHPDRSVQNIDDPTALCKSAAKAVTDEQFITYPRTTDSLGRETSISSHVCDDHLTANSELTSVLSSTINMEISWSTDTDGGRLHDFHVGLASTSSGHPDVEDFLPAHNHRYIVLQNPNLNDGEIFYIVIKTISKAGKSNVQIVGPFLVDKSPPAFQGDILLKFPDHIDTNSQLVIQWDVNAFVDAEDDHLKLDIAIGTSAEVVDVLSFTPAVIGKNCKITTNLLCTTVRTDKLLSALHDQQSYYVTLRATNTGGLSARASSERHVYDVYLPTRGFVIDVDDDSAADPLDDADFQSSITTMTSRWYGFRHATSTVLYTVCVAIGTDIMNDTCIDVGDSSSVTLKNLNLEYFKKYHTVVTARTTVGSVTAFSDGVMPLNTSKTFHIPVFDGAQCTRTVDSNGQLKFHHHEQDIIRPCTADISHQTSLNSLGVRWEIPVGYRSYTPDVTWRVQERAPIVDFWTSVTEPVYTASVVGGVSTHTHLQTGRFYRFLLQFCAGALCFPDLHSDGFAVVHNPPIAGNISVQYFNASSEIHVLLDVYKDGDMQDDVDAKAAISHYEWAITDNSHGGQIVTNWSRVDNYQSVGSDQIQFTIPLSKPLSFTTCWRIGVRGYNKAGLYSLVSSDIRPCDDVTQVRSPLVIDAVKWYQPPDGTIVGAPITFAGNGMAWTEADKDYTPSTNILSAIWPTLRYPVYDWAFLEYYTTDLNIFHEEKTTLDLNQPCDLPEAIACGQTSSVYINAEFDHGKVVHGKRYVACVHANATTLHHEYWDEDLPEISVCSDGVTVDTTPPTAGKVWVQDTGAVYQPSLSELTIYWESFTDVEELRNSAHTSGISRYEVAIGTHHGDVDVLPFTDVGVTNHYTAHGLKLQNGHKYFASVKGTDFIGRTTISVSLPITPDVTPPTLTDAGINLGASHITDTSKLEICWSRVFTDSESSISHYKWSFGSRAGHDDVYTYKKTDQDCAQPDPTKLDALQDGRTYYVSVMAFNGAGLSSSATSWAYLVDVSPPVSGHVFDGSRSSATDADYTVRRHSLDAYWTGFHDDNSGINDYRVSVGTEAGSNNIVQGFSVGAAEEVHLNHLQLSEGATYYITVSACNMAGLCSSATSDGVIVDSSAPIPGYVNDGAETNDIQYQRSRNSIISKWYGFDGPQSGISHYTWRVGTSPGTDDVVPVREVHGSTIDTVIDMAATYGKQLPANTKLYSTVRAYNYAGRWSEATSNGVSVDPTDPVFVSSLRHVPLGSVLSATSVVTSSLKLNWEIEDQESYIERQYLSIVSHEGEDFNVSMSIPGLVREYTFTDLVLHDGSLYDVHLVSCNGARSCSKSTIDNILVDSTPPTAGTFAFNTNHAADLDRQPASWMVWSTNSLNLAWLGFGDEHSGVSKYTVNVGSEFMAADLNEVPDVALVIDHDENSQHLSDEGKVQVFSVPTQPLTNYQHVFVSLWTENGVSLRSEIVHSQLRLVPGGTVELIRRCSAYSCQGHCVCAAQDRKCPLTAAAAPCVNVTDDPTYAVIAVTDEIYLDGNSAGSTISYTPAKDLLAASWNVVGGNVKMPKWFEWSIGLTQYSTPTGVFSINDRLWRDAARTASVYITLDKDHSLEEDKQYSVFVRAWFDGTSYADYKSPGVIVRSKPPEISNLFGRGVKEVTTSTMVELDYVASTWDLAVDWTGKFKSGADKSLTYNVYLSTFPGGHDTHVFDKKVPGNTTRIDVPAHVIAKLVPGVRYYSNVQAVNEAGLHTIVTSDGFIVDNEPPVSGMVTDGTGITDVEYQSSDTVLGATWHGFTDRQSGVVSYRWCVSTDLSPNTCDIIPETDVGLNTSVAQELQAPLPNGQKIINEVTAVDAIGLHSDVTLSNGVVIDTTPPVKLTIDKLADNVVQNPSFEDSASSIDLIKFKPTKACSDTKNNVISGWTITGCATVLTGSVKDAQDGVSFVWVRGTILQRITALKLGRVYRVSVYVSHIPDSSNSASHANGYLQFAGNKRVMMLHPKPGHITSKSALSWQQFHYFFHSTKVSEEFEISSGFESFGLAIDSISVQEVLPASGVNTANVLVTVDTATGDSAVQALWLFEDIESDIKEYMWAIGTVRGGTQLQEFRNVGTDMFGTNTRLYLPQGLHVFVTVIATNGAGLQTIGYSDGYIVDTTPPVFTEVFDGSTLGQDEDFQNHLTLSVNFAVDDPESEIDTCSWAIGSSSSDTSVKMFEELPKNQRSASYQLTATGDHSNPYYVIVRCVNNADLMSTAHSDGLRVVLDTPDVRNVHLDVLGMSVTQYPVLEGYHKGSDQLRMRWTGFQGADWVDHYQIELTGGSGVRKLEVQDSTEGYVYATLQGLGLPDGFYEIGLVGFNKLNIASQPVTTNITILSAAPKLNGTKALEIRHDDVTELLTVDWTNVFVAPFPLYYEVSVGSSVGGADIVQWQETRSTEFGFNLPSAIQGGKLISATVRAVSPSGTFVTTTENILFNII